LVRRLLGMNATIMCVWLVDRIWVGN